MRIIDALSTDSRASYTASGRGCAATAIAKFVPAEALLFGREQSFVAFNKSNGIVALMAMAMSVKGKERKGKEAPD